MTEIKEFFDFINERHQIYLKKAAGEPSPWSSDPIFQEWKFCNVFRRLDKTTAWLIYNVITPHLDGEPSNLLFNIFLFRAFNLVETYQQIGWQETWNAKNVTNLLWREKVKQKKLISGAYMIRGYKGESKYISIPRILSEIYDCKRSLLADIKRTHDLKNAYDEILVRRFWGWGEFTTYQVVLDLSYTPILEHPGDINMWCAFGPGAIRGLEILWPGIQRPKYLDATKELLDRSSYHLADHVPFMTLQDIEFSLCEFSKYTRIKNGGRGKQRYAGK